MTRSSPQRKSTSADKQKTAWDNPPAVFIFGLSAHDHRNLSLIHISVGPAALVTRIRAVLLRDTGATISPFHSFLFLQGLETLSLRVERHVENALKIVEYLSRHPKVERVNHPSLPEHPCHSLYQRYFPNGAGSIFTFEIKGGAEEAKQFIDQMCIRDSLKPCTVTGQTARPQCRQTALVRQLRQRIVLDVYKRQASGIPSVLL